MLTARKFAPVSPRAEARWCIFFDRSFETARDRRDYMWRFKAAWERFASDEANLTAFLNAKRKRR